MTKTTSSARLSVLIISCSLNGSSRSRLLAQTAESCLKDEDVDVDLIDLREWDLPFCDGQESYNHPSVAPLTTLVKDAAAILIASPIYNYDLNAVAKNLIEMTGSAWTNKPVGFLCSAGGAGSYMSPMGISNSLMLDFRSFIIPRFVYALKQDFTENGDTSVQLKDRICELTTTAVTLARAFAWIEEQDSTLG